MLLPAARYQVIQYYMIFLGVKLSFCLFIFMNTVHQEESLGEKEVIGHDLVMVCGITVIGRDGYTYLCC